MKKKINIFLDLEKTIIESWDMPFDLMMNILFIREEIDKLKVKYGDNISFHIFSFAISDEEDLKTFENTLQASVEANFGTIESCFIASNENLFALAKQKGMEVKEGDFPSDLFGNMKAESFEEMVKHTHKNQINVLFDDLVENSEKVIFHEKMFNQNNCTKIFTFKV